MKVRRQCCLRKMRNNGEKKNQKRGAKREEGRGKEIELTREVKKKKEEMRNKSE